MRFSKRQRALLDRVAYSFAPAQGAIPVSAVDVDLGGKTEAFVYFVGAEATLGMKLLLGFLNFAPLLFGFRKTLLRMDHHQAHEAMLKVSHSRSPLIQFMFLALRGLMGPVFYGQAAVREALGSPRTCFPAGMGSKSQD